MKKFLLISGAILLAALIAAGGFWGGMAYQTNRTDQARANFERARGALPGGQLPGDGQAPGFFGGQGMDGRGPGLSGGGGTTGQVKTVDGDVITLSTAQDVTTVHITEATQIEKTVSGTLADLQPGTRILVIGEQDSDDDLTASRIQILNGSAFSGPYPSP